MKQMKRAKTSIRIAKKLHKRECLSEDKNYRRDFKNVITLRVFRKRKNKVVVVFVNVHRISFAEEYLERIRQSYNKTLELVKSGDNGAKERLDKLLILSEKIKAKVLGKEFEE